MSAPHPPPTDAARALNASVTEKAATRNAPALAPRQQNFDFFISLNAYEGPLDLLLDLTRRAQFDIAKISVSELASQYLRFIQEADKMRLEIAADYWLMTAYLSYLKSCALLPDDPEDEEILSLEEEEERLRARLIRLRQAQIRAAHLDSRPRLGRDFFKRGALRLSAAQSETTPPLSSYFYAQTNEDNQDEHIAFRNAPSLKDLLFSYGAALRRSNPETMRIKPTLLFSATEMRARARRLIGENWKLLNEILPQLESGAAKDLRKSAFAAAFCAALEMGAAGEIDIRQKEPFAPIYLRRLTA